MKKGLPEQWYRSIHTTQVQSDFSVLWEIFYITCNSSTGVIWFMDKLLKEWVSCCTLLSAVIFYQTHRSLKIIWARQTSGRHHEQWRQPSEECVGYLGVLSAFQTCIIYTMKPADLYRVLYELRHHLVFFIVNIVPKSLVSFCVHWHLYTLFSVSYSIFSLLSVWYHIRVVHWYLFFILGS